MVSGVWSGLGFEYELESGDFWSEERRLTRMIFWMVVGDGVESMFGI